MAEHTKEPWHTSGDGTIIICDSEGWIVADTTFFSGRHDGPSVSKANARRIVACVNALAHVSTEQLESGELMHMGLAIKDLKKQRDQLLEVAHGILAEDMLQYLPAEYVAKVRAAIAAAEGAQNAGATE